MPLLGNIAPEIKATAVQDGQVIREFTLEQYRGKYVVLFFYPEDFTSVCGSEVHAFQDRLADFTSRDAVVVGCSTDSASTHKQYMRTPANQGGAEGVKYPLIADMNRNVSDAFGTLDGNFEYDPFGKLVATSDLLCNRGLFILDRGGIVLHQAYHLKPIGRDLDAVLRELDAIRHLQIHGEVCMADWKA
ncbi:peroxiredoxin [Flavobacteriales bacterium]|nr:peroxiredoxin [Flavobacteriales bacterium]